MHEQTKRLVEILENQHFETDAELYAGMPYMHQKLIESLDAIEECCNVVEVESKSWHDFWVVQRAVVRALWVALTWIFRKERKFNAESDKVTVQPMDVELGKIVDKEPEHFSFYYPVSNGYLVYFMQDGTFQFYKQEKNNVQEDQRKD